MLRETRSGRTLTHAGTGDHHATCIDFEFPRTGAGWNFSVEIDGSKLLQCESWGLSGLYDELEDWQRRDGLLRVDAWTRCGVPVSEVELADPMLAACIDSHVVAVAGLGLTMDVSDLDCSGREIEDVSGLEAFYRLNRLDLSDNRLSSIDDLDLPHIQVLDVSHNRLTSVDLSRQNGFLLQEFDASFNQIASVEHLGELWAVEVSLSHNLIESLEAPAPPSEDGEIPYGGDILTLDLSFNRLSELRLRYDWFNVQELDVSHNELTTLDLGEQFGLRRLRAAHNLLSEQILDASTKRRLELPYDAWGLDSIDLSHNAFTWIPSAYAQENLRELVAVSNAISSIDLARATKLRRLDLTDNALTTIDTTDASDLSVLLLADNELGSFAWPTNPSGLADLDLSGNDLGSLGSCTGEVLWRLSVEDAGLATLDLSSCEALEWVELAGNDLMSIDVTALDALERIDLRDNPLSCAAIAAIEAAQPAAELVSGPDACVP